MTGAVVSEKSVGVARSENSVTELSFLFFVTVSSARETGERLVT